MTLFALAMLSCLTPGEATSRGATLDQPRAMLARLVELRTVPAHRDLNRAAAYLQTQLRALGFSAGEIETIDVRGTPALIVRWQGTIQDQPLILSAHFDVVGEGAGTWSSPPFALHERGGYYYGRGVLDNKAGVVSILHAVHRLKAAGFKPARSIVIALVGDEETDGATTRAIAAHRWVQGAGIVLNTDVGRGIANRGGDPLLYIASVAEKNSVTFRVSGHDAGGHSSRPRRDNLLARMGRLLVRLDDLDFPVVMSRQTRAYLHALSRIQPPPLGPALARLSENPGDRAAAAILRDSPEFVGVTRTTCVPTKMQGGELFNALPQQADILVNCRLLPGDAPDAVRGRLRQLADGLGLEVDYAWPPSPSPDLAVPTQAIEAVRAAIAGSHPGVPVVFGLEPGGTDGKVYRAAGIPTIGSSGIFIHPDDMRAHGVDERLPVEQLDRAISHLAMLTRTLAARR